MTLSNLRQALLLNNAKILKLIKELENDSSTNLTELQNILNSHLENNVIHVTQNDKDVWNSTLQNAKDYAQSLFNEFISFKVVSELPTKDILEKVIYLVPNGNKESDNNYYNEYMYIDSKWEIIGNTLINSEDIHKHENKDVLDKLSYNNITLCYNGIPIVNKSTKEDNLLQVKVENGLLSLYVYDFRKEYERYVELLLEQNKALENEIQKISELIDSINRTVIE